MTLFCDNLSAIKSNDSLADKNHLVDKETDVIGLEEKQRFYDIFGKTMLND